LSVKSGASVPGGRILAIFVTTFHFEFLRRSSPVYDLFQPFVGLCRQRQYFETGINRTRPSSIRLSDGSISAAWADSCWLVAFAVDAPVAVGVFVPFVVSVVGAAALPVAFVRHWRSVVRFSGGPDPAAAEVSGDPAVVVNTAFPAVADTSDRP